jgi:serine/threonine protein kinase
VVEEHRILEKFRGCRGIVQSRRLIVGPNKRGEQRYSLYEEKGSLGDLRKMDTSLLTPEQQWQITDDLIEGLAFTEALDVLPFDIKEDNAYVGVVRDSMNPFSKKDQWTPHAVLKAELGDFNLSVDVSEKEEDDPVWFAGTRERCAPEKIVHWQEIPWTVAKQRKQTSWEFGLLLSRYCLSREERKKYLPWLYCASKHEVVAYLTPLAKKTGSPMPYSPIPIRSLISGCLQFDPNDRFSIYSICATWDRMKQTYTPEQIFRGQKSRPSLTLEAPF